VLLALFSPPSPPQAHCFALARLVAVSCLRIREKQQGSDGRCSEDDCKTWLTAKKACDLAPKMIPWTSSSLNVFAIGLTAAGSLLAFLLLAPPKKPVLVFFGAGVDAAGGVQP
jgi:hypothetical protein